MKILDRNSDSAFQWYLALIWGRKKTQHPWKHTIRHLEHQNPLDFASKPIWRSIAVLIRSPLGHAGILVTNLDSKPFWSPFGSQEPIRSPSGRPGNLVAIWSWHLRSPSIPFNRGWSLCNEVLLVICLSTSNPHVHEIQTGQVMI